MARLALPSFATRKVSQEVETRLAGSGLGMTGFQFPGIDLTGGTLNSSKGQMAYSSSEIAYRAVQIKATSMAALDLAIETTTTNAKGEEEVELDFDNRLSQVFNKAPYPGISAVTMKRVAFERLEYDGQAFLFLQREGDDPQGEVIGATNLFGKVTALIDDTVETMDQYLMPIIGGYQVQSGGRNFFLLPHQVLWLRYPDPWIQWGCLPPWQAALWSANLDQAAKETQEAIYRNGATPPGVIHLGSATAEQAREFKAQYQASHAGPANAGKHLFIYGEAKAQYTRMGSIGSETMYTITHGANQEDILHAFGVPLDLVMGQSTYDNRHAAWISLWTETLNPQLELIESEIDRQLVPDLAQRVVFDRSKVAALQENADAIQERADKQLENDGITLGEYRTALKLDLFGDERDDMTLTQYRADFKLIPVAAAPMGETNPAKPLNADQPDPADDTAQTSDEQAPGDAQSRSSELVTRSANLGPDRAELEAAYDRHSARITASMKRLGAKQRKVVLRKLKKALDKQTRSGSGISIDDVYDDDYWTEQTADALDSPVHDAWAAGGLVLAGSVGVSPSQVSSHTEPRAAERIQTTAGQVTNTTHNRIESALNADGDTYENVMAVLDQMDGEGDGTDQEGDGEATVPGSRSENIGMTEGVAGIVGGLAAIAAASEQDLYMTWNAQGGAEVMCQEMDGTTVRTSDGFPGGAFIPLHNYCRCFPTYSTSPDAGGE